METPFTAKTDLPAKKKGLLVWVDERIQFILLIPSLLLMLLVFLYPLLNNVYLSMHDYSFLTMQDPPFVAFRNILKVFKDPGFYHSIYLTVLFVGGGVGLQFIIGFSLAMAVKGIRKGHGLITTLFVFPMMVTPVVVGLIWKFILDYNFGIFNYFLTLLGLDKISLLTTSQLALPTTIMVDVWQWTPFMFIVLLAGLKALPKDPYEAAEMDGASRWQTLWYITLPLMKSVIIVALVMRIAGALKVFDQIFVLTGGGPGTSTETVSMMLHRKAFVEFDFGYSAALALVLTIIVGFLCWFAIRALYSEK